MRIQQGRDPMNTERIFDGREAAGIIREIKRTDR